MTGMVNFNDLSNENSYTTIHGGNIKTNTITADHIKTGAITADKIKTGAITADKISAESITAGKIKAGAISADKIDTGAVTADKIASGAINAEKISGDDLSALRSTTGDLTVNGTLTAGNLTFTHNNSITVAQYKDGKLQKAEKIEGPMLGIGSGTYIKAYAPKDFSRSVSAGLVTKKITRTAGWGVGATDIVPVKADGGWFGTDNLGLVFINGIFVGFANFD